MEALEDSFATLNLEKLALRPAQPGTIGTPIKVLVNLFPMTFRNPELIINVYDIKITSHRPNPPHAPPLRPQEDKGFKTSRRVFRHIGDSHPALLRWLTATCFDGSKLAWSARSLPTMPQPLLVTLPPGLDGVGDRAHDFNVTITQVGEVSIRTLIDYCARVRGGGALGDVAVRAIQGVDVLLRHDPAMSASTIVTGQGRKFFNANDSGVDIGQAARVLSGFFRSARPTLTGMQLNLDVVNSPFFMSGRLLDVVGNIVKRVGGRPFSEEQLRILNKQLKGVAVKLTHRPDNRHFFIERFGKPAGQQTFDLRKKDTPRRQAPSAAEAAQAAASGRALDLERPQHAVERTTVADYFLKHYNKRCDIALPCVSLKGGQCIPMECLDVLPGNSISINKLQGDQTAAMIKVTARSPVQRLTEIMKLRQTSGFASNERLQSWGVEIARNMAEVDARVLPSPQVQYHPSSKNPRPAVRSGAWNMLNSKLTAPNPEALVRWVVVVFGDQRKIPQAGVEDFINELVHVAGTMGMVIQNQRPAVHFARSESYIQDLDTACNSVKSLPGNHKKLPTQLVMLVFEDRAIYDNIKRHLMLNFDVPISSQGVMSTKVLKRERRDQYCRNLLMKINSKLHGSNWTVAPQSTPKFGSKTILIGADVTHPPSIRGAAPDDLPPSIAAIVATTASGSFGCRAQVREQEGRKEIITEFEGMVTALLKGWIKDSKNIRPDNIIVYRDGVSEGELARVVFHEIDAIKGSLRDIDPSGKWRPTINYIVCAKRHHVRAFAKDFDSPQLDKNKNLPPGTVIDTVVTHPYLFDFYLQAQAGLVGTAKPTRYICLLNESKFTSNELQQLTNSLCYGFQRATRSVSIVPVACYAHIVCEKARSFVYDDDASTVSSGSRAPRRASTFLQTQIDRKIAGHSLSTMWFI